MASKDKPRRFQWLRKLIGRKTAAEQEVNPVETLAAKWASAQATAEYARSVARSAAKATDGHNFCLCQPPPLRLVIRRRRERYHLARWAGTDQLHATRCPFHAVITPCPDAETTPIAPSSKAQTAPPSASTPPDQRYRQRRGRRPCQRLPRRRRQWTTRGRTARPAELPVGRRGAQHLDSRTATPELERGRRGRESPGRRCHPQPPPTVRRPAHGPGVPHRHGREHHRRVRRLPRRPARPHRPNSARADPG
ncbi:DUF1173 family protein [Nocardia uniformis]|uniref:DUF1173 family protein n=1 Tax=Nocardia uniformis TaxID=53432 RepID=A0A849BZI9_9NOCA|nr:DUF1173 family protein [Nocardia uniformis]